MAWYDDPNNTPGASAPGGGAVPPSQPPGPGQPPPASGHPQMPGGPPPFGPPPGVQGDLPTSGGGNNNRTLLIIVGLAVAAVITVAGGIGALVLLSGPEELSMGDYADKMCDEAIMPNAKELEDVVGSRRWQRRISDGDIYDEDEAKEAIDLYGQALDHMEELGSDIESFNKGHIVRGRDGEELREEIDGFVADAKSDIEKARTVISEADPSDEQDVSEDIRKAAGKLRDREIYKDDRDPGYDLRVELSDADELCDIF